MNSYITFACLLAVAATAHSYGHGYGGYALSAPIISSPIISAPAYSTANLYKAAPIPVIRTSYVAAPIVRTVPVVRTVAVAAPVSYSVRSYGGHGGYGNLGGYGGYGSLGGYGGHGSYGSLGGYGGHGYGLYGH